MNTKRMARFVVALGLVVGAGPVLAPAAQAAPECRGATAVIQCWDDKVRDCLNNLRFPIGC